MAPTDAISRSTTKFVSWNVRGLNHPVKRSKVFSHLRKLKAEVIFLQETHLRTSDISRLQRGCVSQVFHSKLNSKFRGTAILIGKNVQFISSKVVADENGRFIIVQGRLYNLPVVLVNVYAPNWDNPRFFKDLFSRIPESGTHQLIFGGDFNTVLQPSLDRSKIQTDPPSNSALIIKALCQSSGVVDPWRFKNPTSKEFSFFSAVHQTYSRIDFFLLDKKMLPLIKSCSYESIVISDHSPVVMELWLQNNLTTRRNWRLNPILLSDKAFVDFLSAQIDFFLDTNQLPDTNIFTLWETLKVYLRGQIIEYTARLNKSRSKRFTELIKLIHDVDQLHSVSPSADLCKRRIALQTEFDLLAAREVEEKFLKSRQSHYEHGERASRLLSHQLRQYSAANHITEIQATDGTIKSDPKDINDQFKTFYSSLYTSDGSHDNSFVESLDLPTINDGDKASLEEPISVAEIGRAIKLMKNRKAPGPDGYPIEFYKAFATKLTPLLCAVYTESLKQKKLPSSMTQAIISVLPKKDKDPTKCESYRPISLLTCDYKILTKILALRLESVVPTIVHPDQTGFIKGRQSYHNLRRLFNIIYSDHSTLLPEIAISLDAHKAFDRIEYKHLFKSLCKFGFGPTFISWIQTLYTLPQASVRTNNIHSDYFTLQRGTRQGCPLSPLLFDLAIEPLAVALRQDRDIEGINRGGQVHKVSLYADDLLLFLSDPAISIPKCLDIISQFGAASGYKINLTKSVLFPINKKALTMSFNSCAFRVTNGPFTYLGVKVTRCFKELLKHNFRPIMDQTKKDLSRWSTLPLSLAGRINTVKMVILPKFLYLFQTVPIFLPKSYFKELDKYISIFIWNKTIPRVRKSVLERRKANGGLALPNFLYYYWAANIYKLTTWYNVSATGEGPEWSLMEQRACSPVSLASMLCAPLPLMVGAHTDNPMVKGSLRIWTQFRKHFDLVQAVVSMPLTANPLFKPSLMDAAFRLWYKKGIHCVGDLFIDGVFCSFDQLVKKYNIPMLHRFRYFQVRDFIRTHFLSFPSEPPPSPLVECLKLKPHLPGCVSQIYSIIQNINCHPLHHLRTQWGEDLNTELSEETWQRVIQKIHTSSICVRHGLIQFKVVNRLHSCRAKLARIYPGLDPNCVRCNQAPATLGHMFWTCPKLCTFWSEIFNTFSYICKKKIDPDPATATFGVAPSNSGLSKYDSHLIAFSTLLARRLILFNWKSSAPPTHSRWIREVMSALKLEKIRCTVQGSAKKFQKTWYPFLDYFEKEFDANILDK